MSRADANPTSIPNRILPNEKSASRRIDHFAIRMVSLAQSTLNPTWSSKPRPPTVLKPSKDFANISSTSCSCGRKLPGASGIEATAAICKEFPKAAIIMLSTHDGEEDIYRSLQAGARAYILKDAAREELMAAIRKVHSGERVISPAVGARLAERMTHAELTAREIEVLKLMAKGRSNKEIGSALGIAEVTVKLHVGHLLTKLNANDRTQAATTALQRGILHLE